MEGNGAKKHEGHGMTSIMGSIFLGGIGLVFGIMVGKSVVKDGCQDSGPGLFIAGAVGLFFMCGALWIGSLNHWI